MAGRLGPIKRVVCSFAAVALVSATSLVTLLSGTAQAVAPTRIMPLGDSLTYGSNIAGAYRTELEDRLIAGKYDFNFAGSLSNGPTDLESRLNEGHNGYRIDQIAASVQSWLTTNPAEFVLLMIGTNDVTQDYQLSTAPDRLSGLIDQITNMLPSAQVLVASIPPLSDPTNNAKANQYNAAIPGIVNNKRAQGKNVAFVDVNAVLTTADLADGVHLTSTGYAKDGDAWFSALQPLLPPRPTPVPRTCPCTIWPTSAVPGTVQATWDTSPNELGVKFRSDVDGFVSGIRFYKGSLNTGTHVGHLWTGTGTILATATFTNETASGWQEVAFASPVAITADTTYVASYYAPVGRYSVDATYFNNNEVVNYPLRALAWGMSGPNGVYKHNSSGFPGTSSQYSNYWVDVVFAPASTPPPATPANLTATSVATSRIDLAWNDVATETGYRVERSANGTSGWAQVGTTGQNVTSYSDTGLTSATTYFYRVIATNAGGDSPPSAVTSARTAAAADTTPPTAPTNLKAASAKAKVNLSWTGSTDAGGSGLAGYDVWRSTSSNGTFVKIGTTPASSTSYSDNTVSSGVSYWYFVVAFDGAGNRSSNSNQLQAKPK
jgi:lysophospholipase L1-like esterase